VVVVVELSLITNTGRVELSFRGVPGAEVFPVDVWLACCAKDEELICDDDILSWEVLGGDAEELVVVRFGVWAVELVRGRVELVVIVLLIRGLVLLVALFV
jgi:hypothetical protein